MDTKVLEPMDALIKYCQTSLGEDLRAVTWYSPEFHSPIYTRGDVLDQIQLTDDTRSVLRYPLAQLQKAVWQLTDAHPTLDNPESAIYSYGDITVIQFPITREEGVIVTLDSTSVLPDGFESRCKSILDGSVEGGSTVIGASSGKGDSDDSVPS